MHVLIVRCSCSGVYLLAPVAETERVQLLQIDPFTGQVVPVRALYENEEAALRALHERGEQFVEKRRVCAVLGLLQCSASALLYVATKTRVVSLPGVGQEMHVIVQSDVIEVPLLIRNENLGILDGSQQLAELMTRYPLEELHFYSTTCDLTRSFCPPFVVERSPAVPALVWNDVLRAPFVREGFEWFCPAVLQGFCSSHQVVGKGLTCVIIGKKTNNFCEFEIDHICAFEDRVASFSVRRNLAPDCGGSDSYVSYLEQLPHQHPPVGSVVFLGLAEDESFEAPLNAIQGKTAFDGSVSLVSYDWKGAVKLHSGRSEGAAGQLWHIVKDPLSSMCVNCMVALKDGSVEVESCQNGMLVVMSEDGLRSVSEVLLYFSLVVFAELVRCVRDEQEQECSWTGFNVVPSLLSSDVLGSDVAKVVGMLSVECSDAVTFFLSHRESLFSAEVAEFLPSSILSPLHRKVGEYISSLTEQDRKAQENTMALMRKSTFADRIRLTRHDLFPVVVGSGGRPVPLTDLCSSRKELILECEGEFLDVFFPFYRPGVVTHWSFRFPMAGDLEPVDTSFRPVRCDLILGGRCVAERLELPKLFPSVHSVFRVCRSVWEGFVPDKDSSGLRLEEDSSLTIRFYKSHPRFIELCIVEVFGTSPMPTPHRTAKDELWRMNTVFLLQRALAAASSQLSLVDFVGGAGGSLASSGNAEVAVEEEQERKSGGLEEDNGEAKRLAKADYGEKVAQSNAFSLLSLLQLEWRRVSLALSEYERDEILYQAKCLEKCNPRRLIGHRERALNDLLRGNVSASFLSCSSGTKCRGKDAFVLSVGRNRLCYRCFQRFCVKCMEENVLMEAGVGNGPVCWGCSKETEEQKQLWTELQRASKFSLAGIAESREVISLRYLLRLCTSVAEVERDYRLYPFVRAAATSDLFLNLLFVSPVVLPLCFCWQSDGAIATSFSVFLPFVARVKGVALLPPPSGWGCSKFSVEFVQCGKRVALLSETVTTLSVVQDSATHAPLSVMICAEPPGRLCIARIVLDFEEEASQTEPRQDPATFAKANDVEIFGKKTSKPSKKKAGRTAFVSGPLVPLEDLLRMCLREKQAPVDNLARVERTGNVLEFWFVKSRNHVTFEGGGFVLRIKSSKDLKMVLARSATCDDKGQVCEVEWFVRAPVLVPEVDTGTLVWFSLPPIEKLSCLSLEFVPDHCGVDEIRLTKNI